MHRIVCIPVLGLYPRPALSQLDSCLSGPVLDLSTLECSSTHNTLQVLQRTALGPATPKVGSDSTNEFKCTVNTDKKRKCKNKIGMPL